MSFVLHDAARTRAAGDECPIHAVPLTASGGESGGVSILLGDGNVLGGGGMVWNGPMRLRHAGGATCAVDARVAIISGPIFDAGGRVLYVTTYSGSNTSLYAVSLADCRVIWRSPPFTSGPVLRDHEFVLPDAPAVEISRTCLPR